MLHRGELATGKTTVAKGPQQGWFWQVDPVLGVGLDGTEFCLWNLTALEVVRRIPIGETPPAKPEIVGRGSVLFEQRLSRGCLIGPGVAATRMRDRIAITTFTGVRIYRCMN